MRRISLSQPFPPWLSETCSFVIGICHFLLSWHLTWQWLITRSRAWRGWSRGPSTARSWAASWAPSTSSPSRPTATSPGDQSRYLVRLQNFLLWEYHYIRPLSLLTPPYPALIIGSLPHNVRPTRSKISLPVEHLRWLALLISWRSKVTKVLSHINEN